MDASKHQRLFSAPIRALGRLPESAPSWPRRRGAWIALVAAFAIAAAWPTPALTAGESFIASKTVVLDDGRKVELRMGPAFLGPVGDLPKAKRWQPGDPVIEAPSLRASELSTGEGIQLEPEQPWREPLPERRESATQSDTLILSSPGINRDGAPFTGVRPPDTVGDVGPNHYIQMVNDLSGSVFTIYDKSGNVLAGPTSLSALGGISECSGPVGPLGDPIVLYDQLADRWFMSEMTELDGSGGTFDDGGPFGYPAGVCFYISMTPDPTAGWFSFALAITSGATAFDYPKWAVWPGVGAALDGYYFSVNDFVGGSPFVFALERPPLLGGAFGDVEGFTPLAHPGFGFQGGFIPADLDGATPPPGGSPSFFVRHWDEAAHGNIGGTGAIDFLKIWELAPDFSSGATGSFALTDTVAIADFDSFLCDPAGPPLGLVPCVPQPGTGQLLHTLREPVMHRLQYRNFGTYETLVGNFTVDATGTDKAGIRWFELRRTPPGSGSWAVVHDGLHSPDSEHRWMGSIAMDGAGNIALGYSISSSTVFPSIRYTGREAGDPVDTMTGPETTLIAGGGSQTGVPFAFRWGDYSSMNVDPADDCTFWYTNEYIASGSPNWRTRIGTFRFSGCAPLGHFLSYKVKRTKKTPKFVKRVVNLADQFEDKDFKVKKPKFLLTPADKGGEGINDPIHHLKGYTIKKTKGQGKHVKQKNIQVDNQFGTIFVDTKKPDLLLVPTLKDPNNPVVLPEPFTPPLDHFKCYKVRRTKKTTKFIKQTVTVSDQFINTTLLVKKPVRLCVPVDKDGKGIIDPVAHLMCYKVKRVKKKVKGIHVNNQFGPLQLDTKKVVELCVPSTKTP